MKAEEQLYQILKELKQNDVLKHIILIGGWCPVIYRHHFKNDNLPVYHTFDIDLFIPHPLKVSTKIDVPLILFGLGFKEDIREHGLTKYLNRDLEIEFLTTERRMNPVVVNVDKLNLTAQPLNSLRDVSKFSERYNFHDIKVNLPIPEYFIVHKLITSYERSGNFKVKSERDLQIALDLLKYFKNDHDFMLKFSEVCGYLSKRENKILNSVIMRDEFSMFRDLLDIQG